MPNTSVENLKTSTDKRSLPTGKYGHSPRYVPLQVFPVVANLPLVN